MKEKRVVSISLGSSKRNHKAQIELFGYRIHLERIGVDGDKERFKKLLSELDGKVDVFGLGGADLYLRAGRYRYQMVDVATLVSGLKKTPIVDGGELKTVWEREIPRYLVEQEGFSLAGKHALVMSGMDRYGLAEGLKEVGCQILIGDMPFALGIPIALRSLWTLRFISVLMMPVLRRLPIEVLYPTGKKQEKSQPKFQKYFERSDIIAGDFLYIFRFAPENLFGKMLITNTVTSEDVTIMRQRGVEVLVTTTPEMNERSFGTNVLQAIFVAILGKRPELIEPNEYLELMRKLDIRPRVLRLQEV